MSEKYNNRYVPATTKGQEKSTHKTWHLTKSQYLFYYWLIANSCWSNGEKHYYIYDNAWTKADAAKACNISIRTVERALVVLTDHQILKRSAIAKAYEIYWPYDANVSINKTLLLALIAMSEVLDVTLLIKTLSLLLYANHKKLYTFTVFDVENALGLNSGVAEHVLVMAMLGRLEHWHLLELGQERVRTKGINYIKYTIKNIRSDMSGIEDYIPTKEKKSLVVSQWQELMATNKPLLEEGAAAAER